MTTRKFIGPLGGLWIYGDGAKWPEGEYVAFGTSPGCPATTPLQEILDSVNAGTMDEINADPDLDMDEGL